MLLLGSTELLLRRGGSVLRLSELLLVRASRSCAVSWLSSILLLLSLLVEAALLLLLSVSSLSLTLLEVALSSLSLTLLVVIILLSLVGVELVFVSIGVVVVLGVMDGNNVGKRVPDSAVLAFGVVGKHDSHSDSNGTLSEHDVFDCLNDILLHGFTTADHISFLELHGLCSSTSKFSGDNNLHTFGLSVVHDELQNAVARTSDGKSSAELVANRLGLGSRTQTSGLDLFGENLDSVLVFKSVTQLKELLNIRNSLDDVGRLGAFDHNLRALWSRLDFDSSVSIFGEHSLKEFVDLCEK